MGICVGHFLASDIKLDGKPLDGKSLDRQLFLGWAKCFDGQSK
jgi:hypothetical protein